MKILLTGGAGYIGSNVILALIEQNHNIHVIEVNANPGTSGHYFADYKLSVFTHAILLKYYDT